jgi:hypothetical protein
VTRPQSDIFYFNFIAKIILLDIRQPAYYHNTSVDQSCGLLIQLIKQWFHALDILIQGMENYNTARDKQRTQSNGPAITPRNNLRQAFPSWRSRCCNCLFTPPFVTTFCGRPCFRNHCSRCCCRRIRFFLFPLVEIARWMQVCVFADAHFTDDVSEDIRQGDDA